MGARSDFWLHVHRLAECLAEEGATASERREAILDALSDLPAIAQSEVAEDFEMVYGELRALRPHLRGQRPVRLPPK